MRLRLFGPAGWCAAFVCIAALVIGGLGWVTAASLNVENAQREAKAQAERASKERLALWRLDGRMLPALGLENNRPFAHYTALHVPLGVIDSEQDAAVANSLRLPSPLLSAELPDWMVLHFQIDPETGWESPQVIPPETAERLRSPHFTLANVTAQREKLLAELRSQFPADAVLGTLAERVRTSPEDDTTLVPVPFASETAVPKPAQRPDLPAPGEAKPKGLELAFLEALQSRAAAGPGPGVGRSSGMPPADRNVTLFNSAEVLPTAPPAAGLIGGGFSGGFGGGAFGGGGLGGNLPTITNNGAANDPTNQLQAYGFNRAQQQQASGKVAEQTVPAQPGDLPARMNATQKTLGGRGGYESQVGNAKNPLNGGPGGPPPGPPGAGGGSNPPAAPGGITPVAPAGLDKEKDAKKADGKPGPAGLGAEGAPAQGTFRKVAEVPKQEPAPGAPLARYATTPGATAPARPQDERREDQSQKALKESGAKPGDELTRGGPAVARDGSGIANVNPMLPAGRKSAPTVQPVAVHVGPLRPVWLTARDGSEVLVLVRAAKLDGKTVYQGVLLDWPGVRRVLGDQVADLFPAADLTPVRDAEPEVPERAMTALPVQFDPGPAPVPPPAGWTTLRIGLLLAWAAALTALTAVGFGGRALVDLSERRIRFVSAVTHELRTPLTSLRLYLDLLTSGMISDEQKQKEYLTTLACESDRLNRLIENVLDFARLEKRTVKAAMQPTNVAGLLDEVRQTWSDRCAADGRELVVISTLPTSHTVTTDPRLAGQIVGNLVDNARKYAKDAADGRIWVWAKPGEKGRLVLEVEDRGPGVAAKERGSIFRPFRRGRDADTTAGGAGLGLALARHWADLLGGTLSYRPADGGIGACFRLELPNR